MELRKRYSQKLPLVALLLALVLAGVSSTTSLQAPAISSQPQVLSGFPTATPEPIPAATLVPPLPTATPPAPVRARVGIQAGHWQTAALPDEQSHLRGNLGALHNGVAEQEINLRLARQVVVLLERQNVQADLLPARVPPGYQADAFVAIHADYAPAIPERRGYKVGTPWRSSAASDALQAALNQSFSRTEQPHHNAVNANMRGYFAFNYLRYEHAIAPTTPAVIIETGFITNADDRYLLTTGHDQMAAIIAAGILDYLEERDPAELAALEPPAYPLVTPLAPITARLAPQSTADAVQAVKPGELLWTYDQRDGWYHVVLPPTWDLIGWVPVAAVEALPADAFQRHKRSP